MKKIGLIGGLSWESSLVYYKLINEKVKEALGGFHSAHLVLDSLGFHEIVGLQIKEDWDALGSIMLKSAQNLEHAGAQLVLVCSNTMHLCAEDIIQNTAIPFLHIAEATGEEIRQKNLKKVLLLGTRFTMEKEFYKSVLGDKFGIEVTIPEEMDREMVHQIIYGELVQGKITSASREIYHSIIRKAQKNGAEGVVLGCTEIPLLISQEDIDLPVFNTTQIHAEAAVKWSMG